MNKGIKAGSRVVCISSNVFLPLKEGKTYTVTEVYESPNIGTALRLAELPPEGGYKLSRFELAQ
jgi:hypothetical protein